MTRGNLIEPVCLAKCGGLSDIFQVIFNGKAAKHFTRSKRKISKLSKKEICGFLTHSVLCYGDKARTSIFYLVEVSGLTVRGGYLIPCLLLVFGDVWTIIPSVCDRFFSCSRKTLAFIPPAVKVPGQVPRTCRSSLRLAPVLSSSSWHAQKDGTHSSVWKFVNLLRWYSEVLYLADSSSKLTGKSVGSPHIARLIGFMGSPWPSQTAYTHRQKLLQ